MRDKISNNQARQYVADGEEFDGHNMYGRRGLVGGFFTYVVYSWRTPVLAFVDTGSGIQLWHNVNTYGSYTSRHKGHTGFYLMNFASVHGFGHEIYGRNRMSDLLADLNKRVARWNADLFETTK